MATNFDERHGDVTDTCFVTVGQADHQFPLAQLGIDISTPPSRILAAVQGIIDENLSDEDGDVSFAVAISTTNRNVFVYPKPPAGEEEAFGDTRSAFDVSQDDLRAGWAKFKKQHSSMTFEETEFARAAWNRALELADEVVLAAFRASAELLKVGEAKPPKMI